MTVLELILYRRYQGAKLTIATRRFYMLLLES